MTTYERMATAWHGGLWVGLFGAALHHAFRGNWGRFGLYMVGVAIESHAIFEHVTEARDETAQ